MQNFPYDYTAADAASTSLILSALPAIAGAICGVAIVLFLFCAYTAAQRTDNALRDMRRNRHRESVKRKHGRTARRYVHPSYRP